MISTVKLPLEPGRVAAAELSHLKYKYVKLITLGVFLIIINYTDS
jgi:hypothetical protein